MNTKWLLSFLLFTGVAAGQQPIKEIELKKTTHWQLNYYEYTNHRSILRAITTNHKTKDYLMIDYDLGGKTCDSSFFIRLEHPNSKPLEKDIGGFRITGSIFVDNALPHDISATAGGYFGQTVIDLVSIKVTNAKAMFRELVLGKELFLKISDLYEKAYYTSFSLLGFSDINLTAINACETLVKATDEKQSEPKEYIEPQSEENTQIRYDM